MTTYHEVLPPAKSGKPRGFRWTPVGPGRGLMRIDDARSSAAYAVVELPAEGGRGFRFACLGGQTDREAESYDVFVCDHGRNHTCECRGFLRWNRPCKHLLAALDLIANGWLDSPVNPEADVASTEIHDQPEPSC